MSLRGVLLYLAIVGHVTGVIFVLPNNGVNWTTSGPNIIWWTYTASEHLYVNIQLLHNNNETFDVIPNLLTAQGIFAPGLNITNSMMVFTPSCAPGSPSLPTGTGYSLRMFWEMTNGTRTTIGVTNGTFSISAENATSCSGGDTFSFPSPSSSSSIAPSSTATTSSHLFSSSKSHTGAIVGGVVGGLVTFLLVVVGVIMYNRHRRNVRTRKTLQFGMKKGLGVGEPVDSKDVELTGRS